MVCTQAAAVASPYPDGRAFAAIEHSEMDTRFVYARVRVNDGRQLVNDSGRRRPSMASTSTSQTTHHICEARGHRGRRFPEEGGLCRCRQRKGCMTFHLKWRKDSDLRKDGD